MEPKFCKLVSSAKVLSYLKLPKYLKLLKFFKDLGVLEILPLRRGFKVSQDLDFISFS